ncbi:MAG TPA: energy-coupling factor transporter ATPase, partial [Magnetospirillaceae bacterium]|nr:energy-coupling factor transporter ATPase [Magnetospirillaceae bacterium]
PALVDVSMDICDGEYVALAGANGSGKSTLVRCLDGLVVPPAGTIRVDGLDPALAVERRLVRRALALVFQSPQDQIVASVVEEDAAFGLENLGVPRHEMVERVTAALDRLGLLAERARPTRFLSAGQLQRLAVAGALVLRPRHLVFDEATTMIDPAGKAEILDSMEALAASGTTVIHVTHDMDEAARAGRAVVLSRGRVAFDGDPETLFRREDLSSLGLAAPRSWRLARTLGLEPRKGEGPEDLGRRLAGAYRSLSADPRPEPAGGPRPDGNTRGDAVAGEPASGAAWKGAESAFRAEDASFRYLAATPNETLALDRIRLDVSKGALVALVGATGSGKSTLLQLLDALVFPETGRILSFGTDTSDPGADLRALRMRTPLAMQRPESAFFEHYAGDEAAFGPRNQGCSGPALAARVRGAMDAVGLPYGEYRDRPTRELSGGQKRSLAIASVLSMEPDALLLDEPGSALDPVAREALMDLVFYGAARRRTVVFATHSMEEAARADIVAVLVRGRIRAVGTPAEVFGRGWDPSWGLLRPFEALVAEAARREGLELPQDIVDGAGLGRALAGLSTIVDLNAGEESA